MKIENVTQIRENDDNVLTNRYLEVGWILLGVAAGKNSDGIPVTIYSIGWPKEGPPALPEPIKW